MTRLDAATVHAAFQRATAGGASDYEVLEVAGVELGRAHFAISRDGRPSLIIPLSAGPKEVLQLTRGVALRGVPELEYTGGGKRWREPAAVVECHEPGLVHSFAAMTAAMAMRLEASSKPTWKAAADIFDEWVALLAKRRILSGDSELGLWGELWLIDRSLDPELLSKAWRGPEKQHVDFFLDGHGYEVKTSQKFGMHSLSQAQVAQPLGELPVALVSLHVMPEPVRGRTLPELAASVSSKVSDIATFETRLASVGYSHSDQQAYARRWALVQAPAFYAAENVPRVRSADPGVSNLRYQVSLRKEKQATAEEFEKMTATLRLQSKGIEYPCG